MADEADDVAGPGLVHRLAFVAKQFVRAGQAHLLRGTRVVHRHVALEFAGTNPDERDAVAMLRVHVRLDFENKAGKLRMFGRNERRRGIAPVSIFSNNLSFSWRPARRLSCG